MRLRAILQGKSMKQKTPRLTEGSFDYFFFLATFFLVAFFLVAFFAAFFFAICSSSRVDLKGPMVFVMVELTQPYLT